MSGMGRQSLWSSKALTSSPLKFQIVTVESLKARNVCEAER